MATENPTGRAPRDPASPVEHDRQIEGVVLALLLEEHPTRLTTGELAFVLDAKDFAEKDAICRAVKELTGFGLARSDGELVGPTRAAIHFDRLEVH